MKELLTEFESLFPGKLFLTLSEVATLLNCREKVIINWTKRPDPKKRPPRLTVGKSLRFPKKQFLEWLAHEWRSCGER